MTFGRDLYAIACISAALNGRKSGKESKLPSDFEKLVEILEGDMRRYVYDRTPERRIACLDAFRERMGLPLWKDKGDGR